MKVEFSCHKLQGFSIFSNKLNFFSWVQVSIFLRKATQNDHIRWLYQFEQCTKIFGCVGSCGYVPPSVKVKEPKKLHLHCGDCTSDQNVTFESEHSHFLFRPFFCTNFYGAKRMVQFSICSILSDDRNTTYRMSPKGDLYTSTKSSC